MQLRTHRRRDDGVVALEFVLLVPALLIVLFGIITIAGLYSAVVQTTGLARDGARSASLRLSLPAKTAVVGASCPTIPDPTKNVTVRATDTYVVQIPFSPSFTKTITRDVTMRCGG
jgi:Flp pilus assembly protein TadG